MQIESLGSPGCIIVHLESLRFNLGHGSETLSHQGENWVTGGGLGLDWRVAENSLWLTENSPRFPKHSTGLESLLNFAEAHGESCRVTF